MLQLNLFGHFRATLNDKPLTLPTKSVAALIAYLLLEQATPQPREHVATRLWPDRPETRGRHNLRQTLLRLRQTLPDAANGQPPILAEGETLQWNPAYPVEVDVRRFEAAMARAEPFLHTPLDQTPYPAIAPLQAALEQYTADLLLGYDLLNDLYAGWLLPWRTKYRRQALMALARLAECYGRAGLPHRMEEMARRQLALDPEREIAHRQLMQAHLAQGEYLAALKHYSVYEKQLQATGEQPAPPLRMLHQRAIAYREERVAPLQPIPHNLPPRKTPFHGRQEELDDLLMGLVAPDERLLTLTGLGGIGKTRLALTAARHFIRPMPTIPPRFPGGVWFVSLAEVPGADEETFAQAILQSCGQQAREAESALAAVIRHLSGEACLLILDNLEHLPGAGDFIASLLRALPGLTVLATSRHPLGLQQETVWHLQGLPVPADEHDTAAPSVTLFVERLQRVGGDFRLTPEVAPTLTRICRALDGWPLALELAASWGERLPVGEIASRVVADITALKTAMPDVPLRHRSIEAVLNGSYHLLTPVQQRILTRFAVFHGGCTIEAAEAILDATIEDLTLLVRRALLRQQQGRYTIHELIRQFARQKLELSREQEVAERAHATYYLHLLASLESDLFGPHPLPAVRQLRPEWENLHTAWHWAIKNAQHDQLAAVLPALTRFSLLSGLLREGTVLMQAALPAAPPPLAYDLILTQARLNNRLAKINTVHTLLETLPALQSMLPYQQIEAHLNWGMVLYMQGFFSESKHHFSQAVALARVSSDRDRLVESLAGLAKVDFHGEQYLTELTTLLNEVSDLWLKREIYFYLGSVSIRRSHYRQACVYWQKALDIALELENGVAASVLYNNLGDALRELGEFDRAEASFQKSLALSQMFHYEPVRPNALEGWARLCVLRGEYEKAIPLAQEAIELCAASGDLYAEAISLACLGHAYSGLQNWAQAEQAYRRATTLTPEAPHQALESLAGLAYVRWKQGDETAARAHVNHFLALLARWDIEGFASPGLSYRRAAEVLKGLGALEQAEELLGKGAQAIYAQL